MLERIAHRGPDAAGVWRGRSKDQRWEIVFGHRRLSIIDIAGSPQPMADATSTFRLTYNGELFNFPQLRNDQKQRGHVLRTTGDTEVVLNHLIDFGEDGLRDFNGMFGLALWDARDDSVLLARDRAGIKPLYWAPLPCGGIVFASELTAVISHPAVSRELDATAIAEFMFRDYILPPNTILKNVHKLHPGEWLRWKAEEGAARTGRYWCPKVSTGDAAPDAKMLDTLLHAAVRSQLIADVPVGVFLSGGLDSSLVAAIAKDVAVKPIAAFSLGFADATFDESSSADTVAQHLQLIHHHRTITDDVLLGSVDDALATLDEPMGDHSIVPTYLLSKLAAQHVKVVLGGDGADELFGGYPTYVAHRIAVAYAAMPRFLRRQIASASRAIPSSHHYQAMSWKMKRFTQRWSDATLPRHQRWMSATDSSDLEQLLKIPVPDLLSRDPIGDLNDVMRYDFETYLPASVLTKVDRSSMACGLEVRPPYLDSTVIDFALKLPVNAKIRGKTSKWLLKQVAENWLPREIVHRKKHGFSVPLARWMSGPLCERVETAIKEAPSVIDQAVVRRSLKQHIAKTHDHAKTLWSLVVFNVWQKKLGW